MTNGLINVANTRTTKKTTDIVNFYRFIQNVNTTNNVSLKINVFGAIRDSLRFVIPNLMANHVIYRCRVTKDLNVLIIFVFPGNKIIPNKNNFSKTSKCYSWENMTTRNCFYDVIFWKLHIKINVNNR